MVGGKDFFRHAACKAVRAEAEASRRRIFMLRLLSVLRVARVVVVGGTDVLGEITALRKWGRGGGDAAPRPNVTKACRSLSSSAQGKGSN